MPLPNPTTAPCVASPGGGPGDSGTTQCAPPTGDANCNDKEWAADHPVECPGSASITGLEVRPTNATIEVGGEFAFDANLLFSDGTRLQVTNKAEWVSAAPGVAEMLPDEPGYVKGVSMGATTITATYRGYTDSAALTVVERCVNPNALDVVLVIDRSGSMQDPEGNARPRMENALKAAGLFVRNVDFSKDRVAVVSFGGTWYSRLGAPPTQPGLLRIPSVTRNIDLSSDRAAVLSALQDISTDLWRCGVEEVPKIQGYVPVSICCTAIGAGMEAAGNVLHEFGRPAGEARKIIVTFTDGQENICAPDPDVESQALKDEGIIMVVIAAAVPNEPPEHFCDTGQFFNLTWDRMVFWSTCSLFFAAPSAEDLPETYAMLPRDICQQFNDEQSCLYGYGYNGA